MMEASRNAYALAAERAGNELGAALLGELLHLRGKPQAEAFRAVHGALKALGELYPFEAAAGGFAAAVVNVLELGAENIPAMEGE